MPGPGTLSFELDAIFSWPPSVFTTKDVPINVFPFIEYFGLVNVTFYGT